MTRTAAPSATRTAAPNATRTDEGHMEDTPAYACLSEKGVRARHRCARPHAAPVLARLLARHCCALPAARRCALPAAARRSPLRAARRAPCRGSRSRSSAPAPSQLLCTQYRRRDVEDIFTGTDLKANSSKDANMKIKLMYGYYCCVGMPLYNASHVEMFVPAGHVGLLMNEKNEYLFAQPGMHNIRSFFLRSVGPPKPLRGHVQHGNRTIVIIEQGYIGYASDNGQPVLLPPGIHVWSSESLFFKQQVALNDHLIQLGPYTLVTVDEGYAAVTQDNGKQRVLKGGHTHLLTHKNWKFEKFMTLKIQTDELEKIQATSADNINMMVTSTVNWRIFDVETAATMAAETMATTGKAGDVNADISKLRRDVLKQAIASLAAFIGAVNYSESFHSTAAMRPSQTVVGGGVGGVGVSICSLARRG